jgi:hypothetical protein
VSGRLLWGSGGWDPTVHLITAHWTHGFNFIHGLSVQEILAEFTE